MPINTARCPNCGARVNHIVRSDASLGSGDAYELKCPRCKAPFTVSGGSVSQRTREEVQELREFERFMSDMEDGFAKAVADDEGDSVEAALEKADKVFGVAKRALDDISLDAAAQTIDADQLLDTFAIPDVKNMAMDRANKAVKKAQDRYNLSDETAQNLADMAERAYDRASEKVVDKAEEKLGKRRRVMRRREE